MFPTIIFPPITSFGITDFMFPIKYFTLPINLYLNKSHAFSGLQVAGKFFNADHAKGVASLVSEAFDKSHAKNKDADQQGNMFSGFLRMLGFDTKKIGAITVNAIIFVAQLVSLCRILFRKRVG